MAKKDLKRRNADPDWDLQIWHESWLMLERYPEFKMDCEDYHMWAEFHTSARFALFHDKKVEKAINEMSDQNEDPMGTWMGRNY